MLRAWGEMIAEEPAGPGYSFTPNRQQVFQNRLEAFLENPCEETLEEFWSADAVDSADNPGQAILLAGFEDYQDFASFLETLAAASEYDAAWEDTLTWKWALWELYSRSNTDEPGILTREACEALRWFGVECSGDFAERMDVLEAFRETYFDVVGHATKGTEHEASVRAEMEQLFHAFATLDSGDLSAQLKGPYSEFYRGLYGGSAMDRGRPDPVELVDIGPLAYAYAHGKVNDAYDEPDVSGFFGGYWENWKREYCDYVEETIRDEFTLDDLEAEEIEPLFKALTDREATNLNASVIEYLMGGQWGQYVWNDVEEYFTSNPEEASAVLSEFFDSSKPDVTRLRLFREHTIHIKEEEGRSPGSIERMATSLMMVCEPDEQIGLPPSKTAEFVEAKTTLDDYESGFRPRQYRSVVNALRTFRDEIQSAVEELGGDQSVSMLDVHNVIWMYEDNGEPSNDELPASYRE
ncbi:hypothetical protein L593_12195 [Salinarchaeum sp. Harcht-Bsk1]|nr:hypothetical protein L593_12195 [Salinarchaeum sp. Harcht-Bsk1]